MHRIEWTQNGETYAVATDESGIDAVAMFLSVRQALADGGRNEARAALCQAVESMEYAIRALSGDGSGE